MEDDYRYTLEDAVGDCVVNQSDIRPVLRHVLSYIDAGEFECVTVGGTDAMLAKLQIAHSDAKNIRVKNAVRELMDILMGGRAIGLYEALKQYDHTSDTAH